MVKVAKVSGNSPSSKKITINNWRKGYNNFVDNVRRDNSSIDKALNLMLDQDGVVVKRWGTRDYGEKLPGKVINGASRFARYDEATGRIEDWLICVADGLVYVSRNARNWRQATGDTMDKDREVSFLNIDEKVFMANGKDPLTFYDIKDGEVKNYEKITTPNKPTAAVQGDLKTGEISQFYKITAVNDVGETKASEAVEIKVNKHRNTWTNERDKSEAIKLDWNKVEKANRYNIYYSDESGQEVWLDSTVANTYTDNASKQANIAQPAPKDDTTGGPIVKTISYADNRIWGVGDPKHPYRVYYGGTGVQTTAFSPFYGGGWIDVNKGGAEFPTYLAGYRDGKGENSNVLFCGGNDEGSQYQISLQNQQVGSLSYVLPGVARVIGSLGTSSARSVVEAKNNLFYASVNSFNTTGAKPEMLNVLSTDEITLAIRGDVRAIGSKNARKIATAYFENKLFWAVANGENENNEIWILDTEINSWMLPWKLPAKYFLKHTDEDGREHLLFLPSKETEAFGENQLVELSKKFNSDNGREFETHFATGIIAMDSSHMEWAKIKKAYFELLNASGNIAILIKGDMKNKGFSKIKEFKISSEAAVSGWDGQLWDGFLWDSAPTISKAITAETLKKVVKIQKKVNNVRVEIRASSRADYVLSVIALEATPKKVSDPGRWKR
jgi:hypothetical protein|nr:MAG TPA: hypothetical protein [Caudoviricetes sp.]